MRANESISPEKLSRLVGTPGAPTILDIRSDEEWAADPRLVPTAARRPADPAGSPDAPRGRTVIISVDGSGGAHGTAARLRNSGIHAEVLEGGHAAWAAAGLPLVRAASLPALQRGEPSRWVTRSRPKVDRIACPWLIRRFVDRNAEFLFVPAREVEQTAALFGATAFDVEGGFWSHRGDLCTFDTMLGEIGLDSVEPLKRLALIVRGADTASPELAPQAAGLLAASLGLSRMFDDDAEQLEAGLILYDALFRWCRDALDESHDWTSHAPRRRADA